MKIKSLFLLCLPILFLLLCSGCDGEDSPVTGAVAGTVYTTAASSDTSANGEPDALPGATVSIQSLGISTTSDEDGNFTLTGIAPGTYTLACEKEEYDTASVPVTIYEGLTRQQNITTKALYKGYDFYISQWGDDNSSGLSIEKPWKHLEYAVMQMQPGDTVHIIGGSSYTYWGDESSPMVLPKGKPGLWITIKVYDIGFPVTYTAMSGEPAILDISQSSYVHIEGLTFTSSGKAGKTPRDAIIGVGSDIRNVVLKNLTIEKMNEFGINIGDVQNITIEGCEIKDCGFGCIGGPEGSYGGWRNALIKDCKLYRSGNFYADGPNPYDRPDGIGLEVSDGPIEVADCVVYENKGDGIDIKARNTSIHHCIVANNVCDGVKLWGGGSKIENTLIYGTGNGAGGASPWAGIVIGTTEENAEFEIINVTLHDNPTRQAYPMYVQYDYDIPISVKLYNNIISGGYGHVYFNENVNLTAQFNLFYMPNRDDQVFANGTTYNRDNIAELGVGNTFGDPLFIRPAWGSFGDYKLQFASPARDQGSFDFAPADDLEHTKRPIGFADDRGAYEQ